MTGEPVIASAISQGRLLQYIRFTDTGRLVLAGRNFEGLRPELLSCVGFDPSKHRENKPAKVPPGLRETGWLPHGSIVHYNAALAGLSFVISFSLFEIVLQRFLCGS
jgi:hypothetical protein